MQPRWIEVKELQVGDIFMRQDRVPARVESILQNPKELGRLWLEIRILGRDNKWFDESQRMDLAKSGEQGLVLLVETP